MVRSPSAVDPELHLRALSAIAENSIEYQGHGWGCAWLTDSGWRMHHSITPIWEDTLPELPPTRLLIGHARSAFRDEGIEVENNMPFGDSEQVFAFNGELRGVRIKEQGRIGAEKIFNFIKRFDKGNLEEALRRGTTAIGRRTRYVRAMNIVMANRDQAVFSSHYGENPDYFQLHRGALGETQIVVSQPYPEQLLADAGWAEGVEWKRIDNGTVHALVDEAQEGN